MKKLLSICISLSLLFGCSSLQTVTYIDIESIQQYQSDASIEINENVPDFTSSEKTSTSTFLSFHSLDQYDRPIQAYGCLGVDTLPDEDQTRGSIGMIKPAGWHTIRYDDLIKDKYLYNRCHLIAWSLCGENANKKNLITGTRYLNIEGMLPYEMDVLEYIRDTENHVFYRVTPIYVDDELVCRGVQMEAYSIEDNGEGICFNVYCYNVQPGILIDYATGDSQRETSTDTSEDSITYVLNTNTHVFHDQTCASVKKMSESNKEIYTGTRSSLISLGYSPCGNCNP